MHQSTTSQGTCVNLPNKALCHHLQSKNGVKKAISTILYDSEFQAEELNPKPFEPEDHATFPKPSYFSTLEALQLQRLNPKSQSLS